MKTLLIKSTVVLFFLSTIISCKENSSNSSDTGSNIYGNYSDFSSWSSGISGYFNLNSSTWSGYINDNDDITNYSGRTNGKDLIDEYGQRLGYISGEKMYIYYLNNYYPVGR